MNEWKRESEDAEQQKENLYNKIETLLSTPKLHSVLSLHV